jgi:hypothetical protein
VIILPTDVMAYTDGIHPSVKLFNGVVDLLLFLIWQVYHLRRLPFLDASYCGTK